MKFLCTLITRETTDGHEVIAISPTDDVWWVPADKCPPEFEKFMAEALKQPNTEVLGHIVVADERVK